MRSVRDLHDEAMGLAVAAQRAHDAGNIKEEMRLALLACDLERQAAIQLNPVPEDEPTRSILFCSAASLAWQGGDNFLCEQLCHDGLRGHPPPEYRDDFCEFIEKITASTHLEVRDVELRESEFQLSIAGDYIFPGIIPINELTGRLGHIVAILLQRVRLSLRKPFSDLRKKSEGFLPEFIPYAAACRPSSFALTVGLARPSNKSLPLVLNGIDINPPKVLEDFLEDMYALSEGNISLLEDRMGDSPYLVHFLAHAKEIAPDGKRVRIIGLSKNNRKISFRLPRAEFKHFIKQQEINQDSEPRTLRGYLVQADKVKGTVGLALDGGKRLSVNVQEGLEDIVRSYFGKSVDATGSFSGNIFMMSSVDPVEDDTTS